jgi:Fe-S cluster assembly scaffold protein SufB
MALQLIDRSQVIRVGEDTTIRYEILPGIRIKLGIILELTNINRMLDLSILATQPNSWCEVVIVSILSQSQLDLVGTLEVAQGAIGSELHLSHKTIMLDVGSSVSTKPQLKIRQDQVKCGHGATIAMVDDNQLEYLASRGITRQKAQSMLSSASINAVCEWVLTK